MCIFSMDFKQNAVLQDIIDKVQTRKLKKTIATPANVRRQTLKYLTLTDRKLDCRIAFRQKFLLGHFLEIKAKLAVHALIQNSKNL